MIRRLGLSILSHSEANLPCDTGKVAIGWSIAKIEAVERRPL